MNGEALGVQGLMGQGCRAACAAVLVMLMFAGTAQAADPWRPVPVSCVSASGHGGACAVGQAAGGLWKVVVAPGGAHAYGIAHDTASILVFDRNPATGALAPRSGSSGCLSETVAACTKARGLTNVHGLVISPDGANLYAASSAGGGNPAGALAVFDRNPASGVLTQKASLAGCLTEDGTSPDGNPCARGRGVATATNIVMSSDGRHVYTGTATIGVFRRDLSSGALTQAPDTSGCVSPSGAGNCTPAPNLSVSRQMTLSADGRSLYVPSLAHNSVTILSRDPDGGGLAPRGCVGAGAGCSAEPRMNYPLSVTTSPDSAQIYVSVNDGILTFARAGDGGLTLQSCLTDSGASGCGTGRNLKLLSYSAASPDGQALVVATDTPEAPGIVIFNRDGAGNLAQPAGGDGCVTPSGAALVRGASVPGQCHAFAPLGTNGQVTFVDDGSFVVGSYPSSAAAAFKRDLYPQCADQGVSVTQNVAAALSFTCGDRNGDPMAFAVTGNPIAGAVGAVDQAGARVFYNPFSGFLGADVVKYRAVSAGLTSNEATISLNVVPPAAPPPPARRPRTVSSPVTYNWSVKRTRMTIRQLQVRRLPAGATVTLTCTGKRCPLKRVTIKRSRKSTMNVLNAKALRKKKTYRAGQTVDVRVAAPGMNTKVLRFKLRTGKVPKHRTYCVPLGGKRAQRSCS